MKVTLTDNSLPLARRNLHYSRRLMMFVAAQPAGLGALDATEAVGWGWAHPMTAAPARRSCLAGAPLAARPARSFLPGSRCSSGSSSSSIRLSVPERPPETRADGIVALTGGSQRIGDAIDLLAQGYAGRLLISGVNERTSRDEIARLNPGQRRLFECCVDLDYRARNTIGNAIETRRWIERNRFRSIIVVTSAYHMPRTLVELDHALPDLRKVPYRGRDAGGRPGGLVASPVDGAGAAVGIRRSSSLVYARTRFEADPERSTAANLMSFGRPVKVVAEPLE